MQRTIHCCRRALRAYLSGALAFVILAASAAHASPECSNASFKGTYVRTGTGTVVGLGPLALIGVFSADGEGSLTGSVISNVNGLVLRETFTGTYDVKPDCTGSEILNLSSGRTSGNDIVVGNQGQDVFSLVTGGPLVLLVHSERQSHHNREQN
jgi:hypothetical protein